MVTTVLTMVWADWARSQVQGAVGPVCRRLSTTFAAQELADQCMSSTPKERPTFVNIMKRLAELEVGGLSALLQSLRWGFL